MPSIRANGLDIAYEVDGHGPPLVLLHGALSTGAAQWARCRVQLAESFRVFTPDARGHGGTAWDADRGVTLEDLASDLEAFTAALGLEAVHVAGFSLGGLTGLHLALRLALAASAETRPAAAAPPPARSLRVRSLVLIGCDVRRDPSARVFRAAADADRIAREQPDWAELLERLHGPAQGPGAWRRLARALADEIDAYPLPAPTDLRRVRVPVLVACGDRDPFVPVTHAVELFRQLPRAELLVMPGCGHDVPSLRPAELARAIAELCGSMSSA